MNNLMKRLAGYFLYYTPSIFSKPIYRYAQRKKIESDLRRSKRVKIAKDRLQNIFDKIELDCDVFLHCSLTNPGKIMGGTKYVAELICKRVQIEKYTLLVSALPFRGQTKEYLEHEPFFDVRVAPIAMGTVNEYLALMPGAVRSLHPTHSVVALGPKAKEYTYKHHLDKTPFSYRSPYYKLLENDGKILMFGVNLNNVTFFHVIEDMLEIQYPVKVYLDKIYYVKVVDYEGLSLQIQTRCHNPLKGLRRDCERLRPYLVKLGALMTFPLGESELSVLNVRKALVAYCDMMLDGITIYGKYRLTDQLKIRLVEIRNKYSL